MPRTALEIADYLDATLEGDPTVLVAGLAGPEQAAPTDLIYVESARQVVRAMASRAHCALAAPGVGLPGKTILRVPAPKLAFARAGAWMIPPRAIAQGIHPSASVAASAKLAEGVGVGPFAVIEDDVVVGRGSQLGAYCILGQGSRLGEDCRLHPRVTLYPGVRLGSRVEIHSGVVLGADGFGYVFGERKHWKFPQIGVVEIGDDVEIGANTTIDRGSLDDTRIASGVKLDNLVQVAHNVQIGEQTIIASQTGISGSCTIGKHAIIGGQVGIGERGRLEDGAIVGGQSGILSGKIVRKGQTVWGTPCRPLEKFKEQFAWLERLPGLAARIKKLERRSPKDALHQ
jgi:UDP-3-O-[3-hydroxymyristoyl] glucosamine N-acyltransferase